MRVLRAIIVEDDPNAAQTLATTLSDCYSHVSVVSTARNAEEAFEQINSIRPEIVFMDVKLGQESAFNVLSRFEGFFFQIVFTTAFAQFALQAFDYPSPHFLLKPIDKAKLEVVLNRIERRLSYSALREQNANYEKEYPIGKLAFSTSNSTELIDFQHIEYLSADGSYTSLHLVDGSRRVTSKILGHYEKSLEPKLFCRVHRKHMVNLNHVVKYDRSKAIVLHLTSGIQIQSSLVYKSKLLRMLRSRAIY